MKKPLLIKILPVTLIIILIGSGVGVYFWQHGKIKNLQGQVSTLKSNLKTTSETLYKKNTLLSNQLRLAKQAKTRLTKNNTYAIDAQCQTQQLALTMSSGGAAAGNESIYFTYQNTSNTACTLDGYPGFLALDSTGHVLPNGPIKQGSNYMFSDPGAKKIIINPMAKAYFAIGWANVMSPNISNPCINAALIESTPPGDAYPLIISAKGATICTVNLSISALGYSSDFPLMGKP